MAMKIIYAYIQAYLYLLVSGMWRGECLFTEYGHGKLVKISTVTGSMWRGDLCERKTFYQTQNAAVA